MHHGTSCVCPVPSQNDKRLTYRNLQTIHTIRSALFIQMQFKLQSQQMPPLSDRLVRMSMYSIRYFVRWSHFFCYTSSWFPQCQSSASTSFHKGSSQETKATPNRTTTSALSSLHLATEIRCFELSAANLWHGEMNVCILMSCTYILFVR